MSVPRYAKNAGALFSLKYHVVWCPDLRRSDLPPFDERLKQVLAEVAEIDGITIHTLEVMPDHVHVFVEADPTMGVAEIANRLKGRSSRVLRQEFRLCDPGSRRCGAVATSPRRWGRVSKQTIRCYIAKQKGK